MVGVGFWGSVMRVVLSLLAAALLLQGCSPSGSKASGDANAIAGGEKAKPAVVRNGPFGLDIGMPLSELPSSEAINDEGWIRLKTIPKPHSLVETVFVQGYPETGVCMIKGVGFTNEDDKMGSKGRAIHEEFVEQLKTKYGEPTRNVDRCFSNYCSSEYWTMELKSGERLYMTTWDGTKAHPLPENIEQIGVIVSALDIDSTYVAVEYYGKNSTQCDAMKKNKGAKSL